MSGVIKVFIWLCCIYRQSRCSCSYSEDPSGKDLGTICSHLERPSRARKPPRECYTINEKIGQDGGKGKWCECVRKRERRGGGIKRDRNTETHTPRETHIQIIWPFAAINKEMFSLGNSEEGHGLGIFTLFPLGNFLTTQLQPRPQSSIKTIWGWDQMRWALFPILQTPVL